MTNARPIRSFVKRQRQLSLSKQKIFDEMWPNYGLNITHGQLSPKKIFHRDAPLTLEIGFGNGETIFSLAQKYPEQNFIGIEVYKPGIAHLLDLINRSLVDMDNIRIYNEDAVTILQQCIPDLALDNVLILFPDPWPKKRHYKRRLIQPKFIDLLQKKLKPRGVLNIATDWEDYANHITTVLANNSKFSTILDPTTLLSPLHQRTIITKFEQCGKNKGHRNFNLLFTT